MFRKKYIQGIFSGEIRLGGRMVDIHIHIVPGMDDGAQTLSEGIEMAAMAWESGVKVLAATIHANLPGESTENLRLRYIRHLKLFKEKLEEHQIPIKICGGMEIFAHGNYIEQLKEKKLLTLNASNYPLVEFPMDVPAHIIYYNIVELQQAGYRPVLAHPERYECVQKVPAHVYEWHEMGAAIQINKGSILGRFGTEIQKTAESLLKHQLVSVVSSDAHGVEIRTPEMRETAERLRYLCGNYGAELLLKINPTRILMNQSIERGKAVPYHYGTHS